MSSTSMVAAAGPVASTPRGSAIDVFNFDGGRYRTCRQYPLGAAIDVSLNLIPATIIFLATSTRGATATSKQLFGKWR
jgi:hypothetical protein